MMLRALVQGLARLPRVSRVLLLLYLASLVVGLPLAFAVRDLLKESMGSSLVAVDMTQGFDMGWYGEFAYHNPHGLAETFGPWLVGILPVLVNLERLLDGALFEVDPALLTAAAVWLLVWVFLSGGILSRFARSGGAGPSFTADCGEYFFRFLRLLGLSLLFYFGLFKGLAEPLHDWVMAVSLDVTEERQVIVLNVLVYGFVAALLVLVRLSLDYAKIAVVVEKRRSTLLAFLRGLRFVLGNPVKTGGLFTCLALAGGVVVLAYSLIAAGPGQGHASTILLAFLLGQVYLVARLVLKLWQLAGETALFLAVTSSEATEKPGSQGPAGV